MKIGVSIITYKRKDALLRCLESLHKYNIFSACEVSVFDDYSGDGTFELASRYCRTFTSKINSGVIFNKNRAIYYYTEINPCDVIILIEDDTLITQYEWLELWTQAAKLYGHMNFSAPWFRDSTLIHNHVTGDGSLENPDAYKIVTGQCTSFLTSHIRENVGYLNPLFKGFGHGHVEWTNRFVRNGWGGYLSSDGVAHYKCIRGLIEAPKTDSFKNNEELERNRGIFRKISQSSSSQFVEEPWLSDEEKSLFLHGF